jgi:hypothetical protein
MTPRYPSPSLESVRRRLSSKMRSFSLKVFRPVSWEYGSPA